MKVTAYLLGAMLIIAGILFGAMLLGVPQSWLIVIGLIAAGITLTSAATHFVRRQRVEKGSPDGNRAHTETVVN
ncbi:MAG: hypothetical protein Q7Q71_12070 [Verrucomicrobiota bacterium JB023]|nr:hypothetical protein [Verrucomicrobiota bacterium JB023]